MTRKLLSVLLVVVILLMAVPAALSQDKVTIEIWDFQQSDKNILEAQQKAIAQFEKENPNVKVNVTVFPIADYRNKLLVSVQSGKTPDMATLDQIWVAEFAASGAIIPLDDYITKSGVKAADFFPGAWASNVWGGKTWGIPLNNDVWEQMYFNKKMFKDAGLDPEKPPKTWADLLKACKALTKAPDQYGIASMGPSEWSAVIMDSFIYSNGGRVLTEDGMKAAINSPEAIEALQFYKDQEACSAPGTNNRVEAEAVGLFTAGKAAIVFVGSWQQDTFKSSKIDWGIAMMPTPKEGGTFHGTLGGWNMAIFAKSPHPNETWAYVKFLTGKEPQKTVNSLIPARLDAGKEFIDELRVGGQIIFDTVNNGLPRPLSAVYPQISKVQQDMMQAIWAGTPVKEAADAAAKEIDSILAQQKK